MWPPLTGISKIVQEFKKSDEEGYTTKNRKLVNTILYADDQIIIAASEDGYKQWHIT